MDNAALEQKNLNSCHLDEMTTQSAPAVPHVPETFYSSSAVLNIFIAQGDFNPLMAPNILRI